MFITALSWVTNNCMYDLILIWLRRFCLILLNSLITTFMYNVCIYELKKVLWSEGSCKLSTGMWSCSYRRKRKAGHIVKSIYIMIKKNSICTKWNIYWAPIFICKVWKKLIIIEHINCLWSWKKPKGKNNFCINWGKTVTVFHWSVPDVHCASVVVV